MAERIYHFQIPNKKLLQYQLITYCIILLNMAGQLLFAYKTSPQNFNRLLIIFIVISGIITLADLYFYKKRNRLQSLGIVLLMLGFLWFRLDFIAGFAINFILWILYLISRRKLIISVSELGVTYPSFPRKKIEWQQLNQLILKDDVLTIDQKNNKVYQHEILYTSETYIETEFNDFCRKNLIQ